MLSSADVHVEPEFLLERCEIFSLFALVWMQGSITIIY